MQGRFCPQTYINTRIGLTKFHDVGNNSVAEHPMANDRADKAVKAGLGMGLVSCFFGPASFFKGRTFVTG